MKQFNGYRSWNAWNVSLWISNDERLYNAAMGFVSNSRSYADAPQMMYRYLNGLGPKESRTPDGAVYNLKSITEAIKNL